MVYLAFLSEECTELQWVRQDAMLPCWTSAWERCHATLDEYHAGAGEGIPAEPDSITIFDVIPLLFERFILHAVAEGIPAGKKIVDGRGRPISSQLTDLARRLHPQLALATRRKQREAQVGLAEAFKCYGSGGGQLVPYAAT